LNIVLATTFWSGLGFFCWHHPGILLVIVGVAGEIVCEWNKEKGTRGRWIKGFGILLVTGLVLEIWEAAKSDEQVAKITERNLVLEKQLKDVDPLNAQINSVSAVVRLKVKGVNPNTDFNHNGVFVPIAPNDALAYGRGGISFYEPQPTPTNNLKAIYHLASEAGDVSCMGSAIVGGSNDWRRVVVHFHEDDFSDFDSFRSTNRFEVGQKARAFNNVGGFVISLPEMETNVSVVSGVVELKVNTLRWTFPIPAQTQRYRIITSQIATNTAQETVAKVWRMPLVDFVSPPRWTNMVYTGEPY
jgi:hypothetical protein